jgi:hypothetical protein
VKAEPHPPRAAVGAGLAVALGASQVVGWGTLHYGVTSLAPAMSLALGVPEVHLFGAFSASLALAGIAAPAVGAAIDRYGGGGVMAAGSTLAAASFAILATAEGPLAIAIGFVLVGLASAAALYEAAFATVHAASPSTFRGSVTTIAMLGALSSSIFWPITQTLEADLGARATLAVFGLLHLLVCLPIHLGFARFGAPAIATERVAPAPAPSTERLDSARLCWLSMSFAASSFVFAALSAHLIPLAREGGASAALLTSALVGPAQTLGRGLDWLLLRRVSPRHTGALAGSLLVIAVVALLGRQAGVAAYAVFATAFGAASGLMTIVRGTAPVALLGAHRAGRTMGVISRSSLLARASAPVLFVMLGSASLVVLALLAFVSIAAFVRGASLRSGETGVVRVSVASDAREEVLTARTSPRAKSADAGAAARGRDRMPRRARLV